MDRQTLLVERWRGLTAEQKTHAVEEAGQAGRAWANREGFRGLRGDVEAVFEYDLFLLAMHGPAIADRWSLENATVLSYDDPRLAAFLAQAADVWAERGERDAADLETERGMPPAACAFQLLTAPLDSLSDAEREAALALARIAGRRAARHGAYVSAIGRADHDWGDFVFNVFRDATEEHLHAGSRLADPRLLAFGEGLREEQEEDETRG